MKVYSINPNSRKYFSDNNEYVNFVDTMYQGTYNYTPVYPRYTFTCTGRFNYMFPQPEIEFTTMLPIKKSYGKFFVETRFRMFINPMESDSLPLIIKEFEKHCEYNIKHISVRTLV